MRIDLNCDMGESFGAYTIGLDEAVIRYITSANIACGWHAGDPVVMNRTVKMAAENGVGIGAHPGYPDLLGFGRRKMDCLPDEVRHYIVYQLGAMKGFCAAHGATLRHVKPHGALYNTVAVDEVLARAVVEAIASVDSGLIWVTLAGPKRETMARIGQEVGLQVVFEAFPDRAYSPEGTLVSRRKPGAVIKDPGKVAERALKMAREGKVIAVDGSEIALAPQTLCVHGDTPGAVNLVKQIRVLLESEGIELKSM